MNRLLNEQVSTPEVVVAIVFLFAVGAGLIIHMRSRIRRYGRKRPSPLTFAILVAASVLMFVAGLLLSR